MSTGAFTGQIDSITIQGRTFEVFDEVIQEANTKITEVVLGQSVATEPAGSSLNAAMVHIDDMKRNRPAFTVTCDVVIGKRDACRTLTGRPRQKREYTKAWSKARREVRRELVRSAGRASSNSAAFRANMKRWAGYFDGWGRIAVPRSLRQLLGRFVGGGH